MGDILTVSDLATSFSTANGKVRAVNGVSFSIGSGEVVGIVGESGCGKSVTMRSVLRILQEPPARIEAGRVMYKGRDLLTLSEDQMMKIRGNEIAMVFQDAMTSLNPVLKVGTQIAEMIQLHKHVSRREAWARAGELLNQVGIPDARRRISEYPFQFSGGMRQRAMIAMALSCDPAILIADEPTTALDVTVQLQITRLVQRIQKRTGMAVIWITHDLGVVARLVQKVIVLYAGYVVEKAPVDTLYAQPGHPYTQGLLTSIPRVDRREMTRLHSISGQPPNQLSLPTGCPFQERCRFRVERCLNEMPPLEPCGEDRFVACFESERASATWDGTA
jgi:oligopeptide transport system ATP-binding protein